MNNNLLEIKNLSKIYHTKEKETLALENISFNIKEKEFISLVGPSGCGKSTILTILANIIKDYKGTIKYSKNNPKIGYMLQEEEFLELGLCKCREIKINMEDLTYNTKIAVLKILNDIINADNIVKDVEVDYMNEIARSFELADNI